MQIDVYRLPTSDGRELVLTYHTQPEDDQRRLLHRLGLRLPEQPSPRIRARLAPLRQPTRVGTL